MKNYTLIDSAYALGSSYAAIGTELGEFIGYAYVHEDEKERYVSSFFGCELAEMRARLSYLKQLKKITRAKYEAMVHLNNLMENMKEVNIDSIECRKIRRTMYEYKEKLDKTSASIKNLEQAIAELPEKRIEQIGRLDKILEESKKDKTQKFNEMMERLNKKDKND